MSHELLKSLISQADVTRVRMHLPPDTREVPTDEEIRDILAALLMAQGVDKLEFDISLPTREEP